MPALYNFYHAAADLHYKCAVASKQIERMIRACTFGEDTLTLGELASHYWLAVAAVRADEA